MGRGNLATTTNVEAAVPVREGEYGSKVAAVEPGGIEYIAESERHGSPLQLFWTWMSPNLEFATVFVGILPIAIFGGGFWPTVIGVVLGSALGSITHGFLSAMGPRFGVPQLVWSRGAFGFIGNLFPGVLNAFTAGAGWFLVNSVSGTFALVALSGLLNTHFSTPVLDFRVAFFIVVVVQVAVATVGHNMIHQFEKVVFPYLAIVFGIAVVLILAKTNPGLGFNAKAIVPFGGQSGAFVIAVVASFGYAIGWNPFASDYSRYLPKNSSSWRVGLAAGLGVFISCAVLEIAGAGAATIAAMGPNPTKLFTDPLPEVLQVLVLLGIAVGAVAANVLNIYSGAMSFLTLGIKLPLRFRRAAIALVVGIIGLVLGFILEANVSPGSKYESFLLLISYWITPWLAITIIDFFLRRGEYTESEFYDTRHNNWQAPLAFLIGIAASVPFWNQDIFIGPIAKAHAEWGDLSFLVGAVVSAVIYVVLRQVGRQPALTRA
jgi:NCS1 nucleoside transporter family